MCFIIYRYSYDLNCTLNLSAIGPHAVYSKDEDSLRQSFARMARRILKEHLSASRLSAVNESSKLDEMVDAVKRWLDHPKNVHWLMVYDNYDNPKMRGNTDPTAFDLYRFFPKTNHGSIIITTRSL
jgi:hypothetical protein